MPRLSDGSVLNGFFSYARGDDQSSNGGLSALREAIEAELRSQLGRSAKTFRLWQDRVDISAGALWQDKLSAAVADAVFFVAVITPTSVRSQHCQMEFASFLEREKELGRDDLFFPLLYITLPELDDETVARFNPVIRTIAQRQHFDWRKFRFRDTQAEDYRSEIEKFCREIVRALRKKSDAAAPKGSGSRAAAMAAEAPSWSKGAGSKGFQTSPRAGTGAKAGWVRGRMVAVASIVVLLGAASAGLLAWNGVGGAETARRDAALDLARREDALHREALRQDVVRLDLARQEAARQDGIRQEALRQDAARLETARQDAARLDAIRQELAGRDAARLEAMRQEGIRQEVMRQDMARQDAMRQDAARQEAARQDAARQETARQDAARQDAARQDAGRQNARQDMLRTAATLFGLPYAGGSRRWTTLAAAPNGGSACLNGSRTTYTATLSEGVLTWTGGLGDRDFEALQAATDRGATTTTLGSEYLTGKAGERIGTAWQYRLDGDRLDVSRDGRHAFWLRRCD